MSKYRVKGRFHTTFIKLTVSFIILGMLPMLFLGVAFINQYANDARKMTVGSLEQSAHYVAQSMENMLETVDTTISMIYTYNINDYIHVYDILEDDYLSETERNIYLTQMLSSWLSSNNYLSALRFERENEFYHVAYADGTKALFSIQRQPNLVGDSELENFVKLQVLGTVYEGDYCANSEDYIFTVARNYLDTRSLTTSRSKILGTVYADVKVDILEDITRKAGVVENSSLYIININKNEYIYSSDPNDYGTESEWLQKFVTDIRENSGIIYRNGNYLVYAKIGETDCYVLEYMAEADILDTLSRTRIYMVLILLFVLFVLICIYILFSDRMSEPVEILKTAMERVQAGDLSTPVSIRSRDEMEYLGEGFNRMQKELSVYIDQVYKAQISKRDAELNALKMQIQPHYLYNTLDVIRMKALEHDDSETAALLEGLSRQLRYILGKQSDEVALVEELNNIREYFVIVRARYNGLYDLEMSVKDSDLQLKVLKLILQPVVENAVKHGLRTKEGPGKVLIRVEREDEYLNIFVMDNGKGMNKEQLSQIHRRLEDQEMDTNTISESVGLKNVYDRIRYRYGKDYGFEIAGEENFGTIVTFRLPVSTDILVGE